MGNNTTNASTPDTKAQDQTQDASVIVLINVHFNMLPSLAKKHKIQKDSRQQSYFSNIVRNNLVYHSNTQLLQNPDDIKTKEITIPCQDLYFDEDFECIDTQGEYMKIVEACREMEEFLKQKENDIPENSTVQVCINIIGYECIADVAWGLASYFTLSSAGKIKDNSLDEVIADNQIPFLNPFKDKGWSINVIGINIVENGLLFQINKPYDKYLPNANNGQQKTTASSSSQDSSQMSLLPDEDKMYSQAPQRTTPKRISLSAYKNASQAIISPMNLIKPSNGLDRNKRHLNNVQSYINGNQNAAKKNLPQKDKKEEEWLTSDNVHMALDIVSFIPVAGTVSSVANGIFYVYEASDLFFSGKEGGWSKLGEAGLSFVGAIPFSKLGASAVRFFKGEYKAGKAMEQAANSSKELDNIVGGVRKTLLKSKERLLDASRKKIAKRKEINDLAERFFNEHDIGKKHELKRMLEKAQKEWEELHRLFDTERKLLLGTIAQKRRWLNHLDEALEQEEKLRKEYEEVLNGLEGVTRFETMVKEMELSIHFSKEASLFTISRVYDGINKSSAGNNVAAEPKDDSSYNPADRFPINKM